MITENFLIHNAAEIVQTQEGITWKRFPSQVCAQLERDSDNYQCTNATGVELRFVIKGDTAVLKIASTVDPKVKLMSTFHVFHGGIQGSFADHEADRMIGTDVTEFVIKRPGNMGTLKKMTESGKIDWDPEVVRIVFDRGHYRIIDIAGDIAAPTKEQMPKKTLLAYGSSITHGSNALNGSNTWVSMLAHRLNMDSRNLGMAATCAMEPAVIDYIAAEGECGNWDVATLELGINVLLWDESLIRDRVSYAIDQVAGRNPDKPVIVISPTCYGEGYCSNADADKWRRVMQEVVTEKDKPNVTLVNGLDLLGDISLLSEDEVHPSIYGVQQIADRLYEIIQSILN